MKYVSGIRPTGNIHLGNYLGAIKQWKAIQEAGHDNFLFVADLHCRCSLPEVSETKRQLELCGIKDVRVQSDYDVLPMFNELLFSSHVGHLMRMTQFKDKTDEDYRVAHLLTYPVLMGADVIFHRGTHVPVGQDQIQHVEFIRDLCDRTGRTKPIAVVGEYPRIMSLKDGLKKMSKSDCDDFSRINVIDAPSLIRDKIMRAKSATYIDDNTPEMLNLKEIYKAVGGTGIHTKCKEFKEDLAELIIKELAA